MLFVCLGNICRSPLAQGVFEHLTVASGRSAEFVIESCGTGGWHVGDPPDPRTVAIAGRNGVRLDTRARQLDPAIDFERFQLVLGMDRNNLGEILAAGCPGERAGLFLGYAAAKGLRDLEVPDPYYGGPEGFERMFRLVRAGAEALLNEMLQDAA